MFRSLRSSRQLLGLLGLMGASLSGCATMASLRGVQAVPAHRVPAEFLGISKTELVEVTLARLRQDPPEVYQVGPGDILGMYIENVLGNTEELPPFQIPVDPSQPPVIGFPVPIGEDGSIVLPYIGPVMVSGLTVSQVGSLLHKEYTKPGAEILKKGKDRILVALARKRMFRVLVIREESGGAMGVAKRGAGHTIDLPAYENDVLHALNQTGGLPGLDAKNEIRIYRGMFKSAEQRDKLLAEIKAGRNPCDSDAGEPPDPNVTIIPLRFHPSNPPRFSQEDVILRTGDIVMIDSREEETYFTGGVLPGGEYPLPRDKDLDVLGAIALVGGQVGAGGATGLSGGGGSSGGGGRQNQQGIPASKLIVLRQTANGGQLPIRIDLNKALSDPRQRILVQPGDVLILRNTWDEEVVNFVTNMLRFNLLFNGFRGGGL